MTARGLTICAVAAGLVLWLAPACGGDDDGAGARICTPGAYVFCRCADGSHGTKLCANGVVFEACQTRETGECVGGEVDDVDTGRPVDDEGNVGRRDGGPDGGATTADRCPGPTIELEPDEEVVVEGDTTGAADDMRGRPGACEIAEGAPDHVYRLLARAAGTLNVRLEGTAPLDPVIYLRRTCNIEAEQAGCATGAGTIRQLNLQNVAADQAITLVVDGAGGTSGPYRATVKLIPPDGGAGS